MISKAKILSFCITWFIVVNTLSAQETTWHTPVNDSIHYYCKVIMNSRDEEELLSANKSFKTNLAQLLNQANSFNFSLDTLKILSVLTPSDKSFHIITWLIPLADGTFQYEGFIQLSPKSKSPQKIFALQDSSATATRAERTIYTHLNWLGAKYYKLIETKSKGTKYFTLLGWDGNTFSSNKKQIELLTFNERGEPIFGEPIFKTSDKGQLLSRVIFEYAEDAVFSLRYEKQAIPKSKKKVFMIVFDRLAPITDEMKGKAAFYVPTTNICDGFVFSKGEWVLVKDVDVRNPKTKVKRVKPALSR